jgi:hypothetical protein
MNFVSRFWHTTMNPAMYHGHGKKAPFFEGWYFKLINATESLRYAIVPGVFLGEDAHAFVQILNGNTAQSAYHRFPLSEFWASQDDFEVRIGVNYFSQESIKIEIDDQLGQVNGELTFKGTTPWPVSVASPGIMGW